MKHIVKATKDLQEILTQSDNYSSQMKQGIGDLIAAIVNKNVDYMLYKTNELLDENTPMEQKEKCGKALNWLFKDMKPLHDVMYDMFPEHKEMFDKRAQKVEEAFQKYLEEQKKKKGGYNKSW